MATKHAEAEVFALVCRHMHTLVGRRAPAFDDLVQAAAERALRSLPSFEGRSMLSTWVFRVCYSTLLNHRRWHRRWLKRFTLSARGELPELAAQVDPSHTWESAERELRLRDALGKLKPKLQAVVTLHDLHGISVAEVAELLASNVLTVRSRLRDGRKELGRRLAKDPYFGDAECHQEVAHGTL